jgi:hypothetical protein
MQNNPHLPDQTLIQYLDGELNTLEARGVEEHLSACWSCRARRQQLEGGIANFVAVYEATPLPSSAAPRAMLKARLSQAAATPSRPYPMTFWKTAVAAAALILGVGLGWMGLSKSTSAALAVVIPNPDLTPGAAILADSTEVCRESNTKNREVPVALRVRVFEQYGIAHPEPRAYEVDYLITPALGGADDIHNLWPQSHDNTPWNAEVKDALEDHLRELVCEGKVDLATAQKEIASNWIQAYKKYFHTDRPLPVAEP